MISVSIPSQLQSYCAGASRIGAQGATVDQVLRDLDARFPGIRFRVIDEQDRIRRHMRIVHRQPPRRADLTAPLSDGDELLIFGALSGG